MADALSVEDRFWSHIWRCAHTPPCAFCCWPWMQPSGLYTLRNMPRPSYADPDHPGKRLFAARIAYAYGTGQLAFGTRAFNLCHRCSWIPCCNWSHLVMGAVADNARDRANEWWPDKCIILPNGRLLTLKTPEVQGPRILSEQSQFDPPPLPISFRPSLHSKDDHDHTMRRKIMTHVRTHGISSRYANVTHILRVYTHSPRSMQRRMTS